MTDHYTHTCECCGNSYPLGQETTVYLYSHDPTYNHFVTVCPRCQIPRTIWDLTAEAVNRMVRILGTADKAVRVERRFVANRTDYVRRAEHRAIVGNKQRSDRLDLLKDAVSTLLGRQLP
jgi:hypothetical protein